MNVIDFVKNSKNFWIVSCNDSECELAQSINQSLNILYFKRVAHDGSETDDPVATCSGDVVCR